MRVVVHRGDILDEEVDVLITPANVYLSMTSALNAAILSRGGSGVQDELREHLRQSGRVWVEPGTVVRTGPGRLRASHLLHAVSIDGLDGADVEMMFRTIRAALAQAGDLGARTVAMPFPATGHGVLGTREFVATLRHAVADDPGPIEELRIVL